MMKKTILLLALSLLLNTTALSQISLDYYLPEGAELDPAIPTPAEVIGHEVGEWHVTHDKLVFYMYELAEASDRVVIEEYARSYEDRPLLMLTVTSPENHASIEQIRMDHLKLSDPEAAEDLDIESMPVVVNLGYSVHGNEPSGANSSLVTAYYLAAAQGQEIDRILSESVILIDPSINPDGLNRFATWVNMHKSATTVTDPDAREFNERWPSGRTNHYWFDLNRDWLPVQHPESQGRIQQFHKWRPNVLTDHHEMGTNSTFFFQPGIPSRTHPLTPQVNQDLTASIGEYHAEALDEIQTLYYSRESFDDFYYGKGSTYPDIFGTVGILFEQASSRGHAQESDFGVLEFPYTIRNQVVTALSTVRAAIDLRTDLHDYRREVYREAYEERGDSDLRAYIVGDMHDSGRNYHFADLFSYHNVEVYELAEDIEVDGIEFKSGHAWVIPTQQTESRFIEAMFETRTEFTDSLFYDVSTWTLPYAFNLPHAELDRRSFDSELLGSQVITPELPKGEMVGGRSQYAYVFEWDEYYAPRTLYRLQNAGIRTMAAARPFTAATPEGPKSFTYGAIVVPLGRQEISADRIYELLVESANRDGVDVFSVSTGLAQDGIDLGSPNMEVLEKPSVAILGGSGISSYRVGEIWHQFDQRYQIPISIIEKDRFSRVDLNRYNTIILASGNYYDLSDSNTDELKQWVRNGGQLILQAGAINWGISQEMVDLNRKEREEPLQYADDLQYVELSSARGAQRIGGSIFEAKLDPTHPINFGYRNEKMYVFRSGTQFYDMPDNRFSVPVALTDEPLASGYISDDNLAMIGNTPSIVVDGYGSGRVISFVDNTNFRAFWFGKNKLLANALFFGDMIYWASTN